MKTIPAIVFCSFLAASGLWADSLWTMNPAADAFAATGSAGTGNLTGNNYGKAGALEVSSASATNGEFQSLLKFNLSTAKTQFDTLYGVGLWQITNVTLTLTSAAPNNAIFNANTAGKLGIEWLSNDTWTEGNGTPMSQPALAANDLTYTRLPGFLIPSPKTLGTYDISTLMLAGGTSNAWILGLQSDFVSDASAGGDVSFRLYAADNNLNYLSNSVNNATPANRPLLSVTAIPEPAGLLMFGIAALFLRRRRR